jgi:tRNA nucleotidyltransferase/poly(A) polymerase
MENEYIEDERKNRLFSQLKIYKARFGAYSMPNEMMSMWWRKIGHLNPDHVQEAFDQLIGAYDGERGFTWLRVVQVVEAMFPPEDPQKAVEREWNSNPVKQSDMEKRQELNILKRGYMKEIEERKRKNVKEKFDWMPEYAHHFIEVWGEDVAEAQIRKIAVNPANDTERRFVSLVRDALHKRATS